MRHLPCAFILLLVSAGVSAPTAGTTSLKGHLYLVPGSGPHRLLVKFRAAERPNLDAEGRLALASQASRPLPKRSGADLRFRRAVSFTPSELADLAEPERAEAPDVGGFDILQFAGLVYVDRPGASDAELLDLGRELEARADVEYCVLEPAAPPAPPLDLAPPTPDLVSRQGWLGPDPGIDCRYAWSIGVKGKGVRISDIEHSWGDMDHEDFVDNPDLKYGLPKTTDEYRDHGMAIWGTLFAQHNGYGVDGCVPEASGRGYSVEHGRPNALIRASADSRAGDVILLEMQEGGPDGKLAPADVNAAIWDATRAATQAGRIVVGTGGNGGANLDSPPYAAYRARGDNGVIMAGAGSADTRHVHLSFSAYGAMVHVQGWGQNVATTGYGHLARYGNDHRQTYTAGFSGTSSAGGIVAAAVASVQSYALAALKRPLTPREMRDLVVQTGTPQGSGNRVGPLPNIRAAITRLAGTVAARGEGPETPYWRRGPDMILHGRILGLTPAGAGPYRAEVRDATGRLLAEGAWDGATAGRAEMGLEALPAGLHFLNLRWPGGTSTMKIVL